MNETSNGSCERSETVLEHGEKEWIWRISMKEKGQKTTKTLREWKKTLKINKVVVE